MTCPIDIGRGAPSLGPLVVAQAAVTHHHRLGADLTVLEAEVGQPAMSDSGRQTAATCCRERRSSSLSLFLYGPSFHPGSPTPSPHMLPPPNTMITLEIRPSNCEFQGETFYP
jgi:hypothetical protein